MDNLSNELSKVREDARIRYSIWYGRNDFMQRMAVLTELASESAKEFGERMIVTAAEYDSWYQFSIDNQGSLHISDPYLTKTPPQ